MTNELTKIEWEPPQVAKAGLPDTVDFAVVVRTMAEAVPVLAEMKAREVQKSMGVFAEAAAVHARMRGQYHG